jgi:hypothetical protein
VNFRFEENMSRIESKDYILDLEINSENEKNKTTCTPYHRRVGRCEFCGAKYTMSNKARHDRSEKHQDGKYIVHERFEMS